MQRFASWLASLLIRDWDKPNRPEVRVRYGTLEGWISIGINLVLASVKIVLGLLYQSTALIADAVHSLSDMGTSLVVIVGFKVSHKPPDEEHPFGHAKAEYVATLVIAVLMAVAGIQVGQHGAFGLYNSVGLPGKAALPLFLFAVMAVDFVLKELLSRFSASFGRIIGSKTLAASSWHHRSDAFSTAIVIVGMGGRNLGLPWLDDAAGLLVGGFIVYTGFKLAIDSISPLLGESVEQEEIQLMRKVALEVEGVVAAHDVRVHKYGHRYFISIHVEISDRMDVHKMHELSVVIETRILKRFSGECVVHVDPVNLYHPLLHHISDTLRDVVIAHPDMVDFRDLNLWSADGQEHGDVEISVEPNTPEGRYPILGEVVRSGVRQHFPSVVLNVRFRVDFSARPLTS